MSSPELLGINPFSLSDDLADAEDTSLNDLVSEARKLAKNGKAQEAIAIFENLLKESFNNAEVLANYARAMRDLNQHEKAEKLFAASLKIFPENIPVVMSYGKLLLSLGRHEKAFPLFDRALEISDNVITVRHYANILAKQGCFEKAFLLFDRALGIEPNNVITVNTYANLLAKQGYYEKAFHLFDRALEIEPDNVITVRNYANLLAKQGYFEKAFSLFDRALELEPENIITSNTYANLLANQGCFEKSFSLFDRALKLEPDNAKTLASYANILANQGCFEKSFNLFNRALEVEPKNVITVRRYGNLLANHGYCEEAFSLFESALELESNNVITLNTYANLLVKQGYYEKACPLFRRALKLEPNDIKTLTSYANALTRNGRYREAFILFEKALVLDKNDSRTINHFADALLQSESWERLIEIQPDSSYVRFKYSQKLESEKKYQEALEQLIAIDLSSQQNYHANLIRLSMGRLYYLINQSDKATQLIEEAINNSEDTDKDKSRLYAARSLLASNPHSEEAINILREIQETSPRYKEAMKTIASHADPETTYELFAGQENPFGDTTMLYRAMYHKISNEVAILKSISQRILRKIEGEHPLVHEIVQELESLQKSVIRQRATEKEKIINIPHESYKELIEVVSKTAHNIADEVNTSLAIIVSKIRLILRKLPAESPLHQSFEKLLIQLELTQNALNDLKSINEGIKIRCQRFPVYKLFDKWQPENWSNKPRLNRAGIRLNIQNPDSEFDGDEEKIKSILNELVENALKQNENNPDFCIWIRSQDLWNPKDVAMPSIPGDRKYLFIQVTDNGKGVPEDKKEWIFQPLNTTSAEGKGSGLGLFIVRKTLQKMGGQIRETGDSARGARFQIYIPYISDQND